MANDPDQVRLSGHDRGEFGMPTIGTKIHEAVEQAVGPWEMHGRVFDVSMSNFLMQVTEKGIDVNYGEKGHVEPAVTDEARIILSKILPELLTTFLDKNRKYAEVQKGYDLGDKGIVPDLNRKLGIIKARLWDDAPEVGESTEEVLEDMVGHILLMLAKRWKANQA